MTLETTFKDFLLKNRRNRITLLIAAIAIVLQFAVFKYFYPYASYIHGDSFSYLDTAYLNLDINTYMVGYSRFLRLFSVFTKSDTALVGFQYLLVQFSALYLLFTLYYFYKPGKVVQMILLVFMVFNPLFLYMGNMVSSDSFFLGLSLIWFTLLLWIIHKPSKRVIFWTVGVLFIAFTVRYNALIYPFISIIVILLAKLPARVKLAGITATALLCYSFVFYTSYKYKQLTGIWQYSPFSGWQWTNNAMYAYRYVDSASRKPVPKKFQAVDNMVRRYFDTTRDLTKHPEESMMASTMYMWTPDLTLYKYRDGLFKKDSTASELKKWASMGPFYKEYGIYLIKQYPWEYIKYFLWPNANKYYAPPIEFLHSFNSGKDSVNAVAKAWFGYKSLKIPTRTKDLNIGVLDFYPILSGVINVVLFFTLICFSLLNGFRSRTPFSKGIMLGGLIWFLNAGFTILASSAALRFQSFPIMITTIFSFLLVDWMWKMAIETGAANQRVKQLA